MSIIYSAGSSFQATAPGPTPGNAPGATIPSVKNSVSGFPLVNGTPVIMTVGVPADGSPHFVIVAGFKKITTTEVGGQITMTFTAGGNPSSPNLISPNQVGGTTATGLGQVFLCDPGTIVTVQQATALTSGASAFTGSILVA